MYNAVALVDESYEIFGGEKFMSPTANIKHGSIIINLIATIGFYVKKNKIGYVFADDIDVHLPSGDLLRPDFIFIGKENGSIVTDNERGTIRGVPDFVVEILSKSTMHRDLTIKKDIYEKNCVKEYWIIDPWKESVMVYILRDGKFEFDEEYIYYHEDEWEQLNDEEKSAVKSEVKVSTIDGLSIKIRNIFEWFIE